MHKISAGDGFAVLDVEELECLFSGSFKKCIGFISENKLLAHSNGLAIVSANCARQILNATNIQL